jgi:hypothetical protein
MSSVSHEDALVEARVRLSPGELIDRITILKIAHLPHLDGRACLASGLGDLREVYRATCAQGIETRAAFARWTSVVAQSTLRSRRRTRAEKRRTTIFSAPAWARRWFFGAATS